MFSILLIKLKNLLMKKQILSCLAFLLMSAAVCINSTAHSAITNTSQILIANDTTPPMHHDHSDSNWNKNKSKHKMRDSTNRMNDSTNMMRDSTK